MIEQTVIPSVSQEQKDVDVQHTPAFSNSTKSKSIRINLDGVDFLDFHNISGRVVFKQKMNERSSDEAIVKLAISLLKKEIQKRLVSGEQFIDAESI